MIIVQLLLYCYFGAIYMIYMSSRAVNSRSYTQNHIIAYYHFQEKLLNGKKLCNFSPLHEYTSTKQDVIFFYTTITRSGIILSVLSLRHVDPNCRIVFFVSPQCKIIGNNWKNFLIENNVEIEIMKENNTLMTSRPNCYRFYAEQKWLHEHGAEVKRIFHSDSGDVFFPENPFAVVPYDILYFISEGRAVNKEGCNTKWMKTCGGEEIFQKIGKYDIINSGSICGSSSEYIKLLDFMLETPLWKKCIKHGPPYDQPIVTILLNIGNFTDIVKYHIVGFQEGFMTMGINKPKNSNLDFKQWYDYKLFYIHQYNRFPKAIDYLYKICDVKRHANLPLDKK